MLIIRLSDDERVVGRFRTKKRSRIVAWITFGVMLVSVLLMLWQIIFKY
jgi:hypothetical protein